MWSIPSRLRHPLVRFVRWRMVANALSMGFDVLMLCQCWAGEVVEGQQFVAVLDQAFDRLGVFRFVGADEQVKLLAGIFTGLGLPDVVQRLLCLGLTALGR